jgi:probable rRNA maturation factor
MSSSDPHHTDVLVDNRQNSPVDEIALSDLALECLAGEGVHGELSVSFVDADEMAALHVRFMGEEGPTDVLSFSQHGDDGLIGDVVICPSVAAENNPDVEQELRLLIVHGILHLLGHDHENENERAQMWAKQERYTGMTVS